MSGHVFITPKHYERCLETGLFGVKDEQVNFLARVRVGDLVFIFGTSDDRLAGPFRIRNALFRDETPVWGDEDKFFNRVCFGLGEGGCGESDIRSIWSVLLGRPRELRFAFATRDRSTVPLLPCEEEKLAREIITRGRQIQPVLKVPPDVRTNKAVDLTKGVKKMRFSSEAKLEAALLMNASRLFEIMQAEGILPNETDCFLLNQVTLAEGGKSIDILIRSGLKMASIELKKDEIDQDAIAQVRRYGDYWTMLNLERPILVTIGASITPGLSMPADVRVWTYQLIAEERRLNIHTSDTSIHSIQL
jgi:hypothetical protein